MYCLEVLSMSTARNVNYAASVKQYYTVPDEEKAKYAKKIYDALRVIIDKFNFENHTRVAIKLFILDAEQELSCPSIIFNDEDKSASWRNASPKNLSGSTAFL